MAKLETIQKVVKEGTAGPLFSWDDVLGMEIKQHSKIGKAAWLKGSSALKGNTIVDLTKALVAKDHKAAKSIWDKGGKDLQSDFSKQAKAVLDQWK